MAVKRMDDIELEFTSPEKGYSQYEDCDFGTSPVVPARYVRVPGFERNPDICAIPRMMDYSVLKDQLTTFPPHYDPEEIKTMNKYEKKRALRSLAFVNYPMEHCFGLYEMIYKCLMESYAFRENVTSDRAPDSADPFGSGGIWSSRSDSINRVGFAVLYGLTGSGKTVSVKQVKSTFPTAILHRFYGREYIQIPFLLITATIGNMSGPLNGIAVRIDEIADTGDFHAKQMRHKNIVDGCALLASWIKIYHIGMIAVDEAQFLDFGKKSTSIENLVAVSEETGCSILLIGNRETVDKINGYPRILSRIGDNRIEAKCTTETGKKYLLNLLTKLWAYNWTKFETPLTNELADVILSESMYNVWMMKDLVMLIQYEAINSPPKNGITPEFVSNTAEKHFSELRTILYRDTPESEKRAVKILEGKMKLPDDDVKAEDEKKKLKVLDEVSLKDSILPENLIKFENAYNMLLSEGFLKADINRAFRMTMNADPGFQFLSAVKMLETVYGRLHKNGCDSRRSDKKKTACETAVSVV